MNHTPHVVMKDGIPVAVALSEEGARDHVIGVSGIAAPIEWTETGKLWTLRTDPRNELSKRTRFPERQFTGWEVRPVIWGDCEYAVTEASSVGIRDAT